jgi:hypothetical protein
MKKLLVILAVFSIALAVGCASQKDAVRVYVPNENCKIVRFKAGAEPAGCHGIKWGADLSRLEGMVLQRKDPSHGGVDFYSRTSERFTCRNEKTLPIQLGFWKGKFYVWMVSTKGEAEWSALRDTVFNQFGEGAKPFSNKEEYLWIGANATMGLQFDEISKTGTYYLRSTTLEKQLK